jgi:hypothetical protein
MIYDWAKSRKIRITWGKGSQTGSFVPVLDYQDNSYPLFAVYTYGSLEVYFQWYQYRPPFDAEEKRLEMLDKLNAIDGIDIPAQAISRRPNIALAVLQDKAACEQLLAVFDWYIEEVKKL